MQEAENVSDRHRQGGDDPEELDDRSRGGPLGAADRFCPRCGTGVATRAGVDSSAAGQAREEPNPWVQVAAKLRGATTGEFEILRELGRGGMAAVYLAHEVALNRKVAIKVMSPALLTGEGMVRRFRQEAVTVANMSHPHIITTHALRQIEAMRAGGDPIWDPWRTPHTRALVEAYRTRTLGRRA